MQITMMLDIQKVMLVDDNKGTKYIIVLQYKRYAWCTCSVHIVCSSSVYCAINYSV